MKKTFQIIAALIVATFVMASCSSKSKDEAPSTAVKKTSTTVAETTPTETTETTPSDNTPFTDVEREGIIDEFVETYGASHKQASCLADELEEQRRSMDVTENMDEKAANKVYDSFGFCGIDIRELVIDSTLTQAGSSLADADKDCVRGVLDEETVRDLFVAGFLNDINRANKIQSDLQEKTAACITQ